LVANKQLEYYRKYKINPVVIETSGDKWLSHIRSRYNLYENHIKIPLSWFKGKQVLEFGPNGGENSLVIGERGAFINLVEPNIMMHKKIKKLYKEKSLNSQLI